MRRRSKREPNETESTGKIGHELPANQPRPLVPNYPDDLPRPAARPVTPPAPASSPVSRPHGHRHAPQVSSYDSESAESGRLELETQPDMPSLPPQENLAAGRTATDPKGFVVLTIGLPGSGKTTWFKRRGVTPLSSDMLRTILFDDITEQR